MNLRYTRRANAQLDAILSHVASDAPGGAANLLARIEAVEGLLRLFPFSGRMTTMQGIRRIPVVPYPYVLDYRCIGSDVVVQRVRHTSRRPLGR